MIKSTYLEGVIGVCEGLIQERLTAAWVVGSLATGDFEASRSDIDLHVISPSQFPLTTKQDLARELSHQVLACPAHGLDLVIYRRDAAERITRAPEYEFSISTGIDWHDDVSFGGPYPGGLIDLAVSRQLGRRLVGLEPRECVGPVPERWVMDELLAGLHWHVEKVHDAFHDPTGSNAVFNACRALHYRSTRAFVSKRVGAEWILAKRAAPVVAEALHGRDRRPVVPLDRSEVLSFLGEAIAEFQGGTV